MERKIVAAAVCAAGGYILVSVARMWYAERSWAGKRAYTPKGCRPLIGHLYDRSSCSNDLEYLMKCWKEAGGSDYEFTVFGNRILFLSNWEDVKYVLTKRPKTFVRDEGSWGDEAGMSSGLFNVGGLAEWGRIRRLTAPSFNAHNVDGMAASLCSVTERFLGDIGELGLDGQSFDCLDVLSNYTLNVLCELAFGDAAQDIGYLKSPDLFVDIKNFFRWIYWRQETMMPHWLAKVLNLKVERDAKHSIEMLDEVVSRIRAKVDTQARDGPPLLLNNLVNASISDTNSGSNAATSRHKLSESEICAQIKTFIVAGMETTAVAMSVAIRYLSTSEYWHLQEVICEEGKRVYGVAPCPSSLQHLLTLPFCEAVMKEALRLAGPAPGLGFSLSDESEPETLPSGYIIGPKVRVDTVISLYAFSSPVNDSSCNSKKLWYTWKEC
jgi:cytochrome P450